ncbi:MAG TPA: sulfotransferase family 2 domain-containing protein [Candidatus Krumholzibacteria bacterium]|nr:sulfotransferase family 2 domain-containing protein [Candidatus Krumholzibacteria bacterium]
MARPLLVFIHIPKTAGRSLETMLRSTYGVRYYHAVPWAPQRAAGEHGDGFSLPTYDHADFRRLRRLSPGMRAVGGHQIALWSDLHALTPCRYFTFLREPLARGASAYLYHRDTEPDPLTWEQWLAWPEHHAHQTRYLDRGGDPQGAIDAIERLGVFVGLMERYEESLLLLKTLVAPELNPAYLRVNVGRSSGGARELLDDPAAAAELRRIHAADFPVYAHVRDVLWPRWCEAYGPGLAEDAERLRADPERGFNFLNAKAQRGVRRFWVNPWMKVLEEKEPRGRR